MTDEKFPTIYNRGVSGSISGFNTLDTEYSASNTSIDVLMKTITDVQNQFTVGYSPSTLKELLLGHISDTSNPHRDTFASLGVDVSTDLIGSILPGTVPTQPPSYCISPICLLPNVNLPVNITYANYIADLSPITVNHNDDADIAWVTENGGVASLDDFYNKRDASGYTLVPTINIGIGTPAVLCKRGMKLYPVIDSGKITHDPYTTITDNHWTTTTTDNTIKILPSINIPVNIDNTGDTEVTMLWPSLTNLNMANNAHVYLIFTTKNSDKLVICYTNNGNGQPNVSMVYKSGYIEPVMLTGYSLGGVRFKGKKDDLLTVTWTVTGTPDWSSYQDGDIKISGGEYQLPDVYPIKFIEGNPNFLTGTTTDAGNVNNTGLLLNNVDKFTLSSDLAWDLPALSQVKNIGVFSLTVCVDNSVNKDSSPVTVFTSDKLTLAISIHDNGHDPVSVWHVTVTDGTNNQELSLGGNGGYVQSIALSLDGSALRVKCSGASSTTQVACNMTLGTLPNSHLGNFDGGLLELSTYSVTDNAAMLDFIVGDTSHS